MNTYTVRLFPSVHVFVRLFPSDHVFHRLLDGVARDGDRQHAAAAPRARQPDDGRRRVREETQGQTHPHRARRRRHRVPLLRRVGARQLSAGEGRQERTVAEARGHLLRAGTQRHRHHYHIEKQLREGANHGDMMKQKSALVACVAATVYRPGAICIKHQVTLTVGYTSANGTIRPIF